MEKILTVTVPAYNAEKFLETNLRSFCISELLPKLEILIIDDGSTDGTLTVAQKYSEQYPDTFKVITKENGGHGSCINVGIEQATGRYFKVVDADDWVVEDGFCVLMDFLQNADTDLVYTGFLWAYDRGEADVNDFETKAEFTEPFRGVEYNKDYNFDDIAEKCYIKMHNFTVKTELLKKMPARIDEHCYYVDYEYITYPIPLVKTTAFLDFSVYRYRLGTQGQSMNIDQMLRHTEDMDKVLKSMLDFYDKLGMDIPCTQPKKRYVAGIIARLVASRFKVYLCELESEEIKKELQDFNKEIKQQYPEVYKANQNKAVKMLRISGFSLYKTAARVAKKEYQVSGS